MKLSTGLVIEAIPDLSGNTEGQKEQCRSWIAALRSGDYRQSGGCLRKRQVTGGDAFCCLGVACDIAAKAGLGKWWSDGGCKQAFSVGEETPTTDWYWLPEVVRRHYGLSSRGGITVVCRLPNDQVIELDLMALNDQHSATFLDIALIVETALAGGLKPTAN